MKKKYLVLVVSFFLFFISSCQPKEKAIQQHVWHKGANSTPPDFISNEQFQNNIKSIDVAGEKVIRNKQSYQGFNIYQGVLTLIHESKTQNLEFSKITFSIDSEELKKISSKLQLEKFKENSNDLYNRIKEKFKIADFDLLSKNNLQAIAPAENYLIYIGHITPVLSIKVLNLQKALVSQMFFDKNAKLVKEDIISSDFDAQAWIYPFSDVRKIKETALRKLELNKGLKNQKIFVLSSDASELSDKNAPWQFPTSDPRFDQIQAFHYADTVSNLLEFNFGFSFLSEVQIQTAFNYPEKTNAAFTFNNQIRLGLGDGLSYKSLAQDPTIIAHELGHVIVSQISGLATQGESGSLNEAFADYISASLNQTPLMGSFSYIPKPFKRNLEEIITWDMSKGGLYYDSQIFSGILWEMRKTLSPQTSNKIVLRTISRLSSFAKFTDFPQALLLASKDLISTEEMNKLIQILRKRNVPEELLK